MNIDYIPLLQTQRDIQGLPRNFARFQTYLDTVLNADRTDVRLTPLLAANPMAKDHVTALLDAFLVMDADGIAARTVAEASTEVADIQGDYNAALVVVDDLMGGWTNRYAEEFTWRFGHPEGRTRTRVSERMRNQKVWICGILWSSEAGSDRIVREAMLTALYRFAFVHRHGLAHTLRDMLVQEGQVMAMAGCTGPVLDEEDMAYTREVLMPYFDATDMRTCVECLFGDAAGRTLGFTPRGLSHWAGIALALHDARALLAGRGQPHGALT